MRGMLKKGREVCLKSYDALITFISSDIDIETL